MGEEIKCLQVACSPFVNMFTAVSLLGTMSQAMEKSLKRQMNLFLSQCGEKRVNFFFFFFFFCFLGPYLWHMEVPRLEVKVKSELQLPTTATAMQDQSLIFDYTTAHGNARSLTH